MGERDVGADLVEQRWPAVAASTIVAVLLIAPRTAAGLAFVLAALPFAWVGWRGLVPTSAASGLLAKAAMLFCGYMAFSIVLSVDRTEAIGKTLLFAGLAVAIAVAAAGYRRASAPQLLGLGRAAVTGFAIALAFLCIEETFDHVIKNNLYRAIPLLAPDAKHVSASEAGLVAAVYLTNRSIAFMVLALGPVLVIASMTLTGIWRTVALLGLPFVALHTAFASQHESSQLGLAAGAAILAAGLFRWRAAMWLVVAGWVAANALVVPAVQGLYATNLHVSSWLPFSAKARVILWNYTAEQVWRQPLLGVGLASTRRLDDRRAESAPTLPGHVFPQRTGPHAHNIYLQTWYELGLVGAVLLTALGLGLIAAIARLQEATRPYALATFAAAAAISASSWGLWQPWFMAMLAIAAILVVMADAITASSCDARTAAGPARSGGAAAPA